jgi:hypothetical protein
VTYADRNERIDKLMETILEKPDIIRRSYALLTVLTELSTGDFQESDSDAAVALQELYRCGLIRVNDRFLVKLQQYHFKELDELKKAVDSLISLYQVSGVSGAVSKEKLSQPSSEEYVGDIDQALLEEMIEENVA